MSADETAPDRGSGKDMEVTKAGGQGSAGPGGKDAERARFPEPVQAAKGRAVPQPRRDAAPDAVEAGSAGRAPARAAESGNKAAGTAGTGEERVRPDGPGGTSPAAGPGGGPDEDVPRREDTASEEGTEQVATGRNGEVTGRQRLVAALWPPRVSRAQLTVALLLFVLGLGLAIQVRSTSDESRLRGARQEDLIRILDELDSRTQRLLDEKGELEEQRTELENSSNKAEEARRQTKKRADQLAVLAGTVAAQGPGITLTITDPGGRVRADMLLDTLQELRAAGAEAIQINDVRVVADTYFSDNAGSGGVEIDGHQVVQPYRFKVIGNPQDLEPALNIPGGVVQSFEKEQASVGVVRSEKIIVDALRQVRRPDYARSAPE